ncbi:MAG: transcriptional regulator, partial [Clostridiaceae bacterium]|nr:transcriptional regulator [Clostridiaceae bacterium]
DLDDDFVRSIFLEPYKDIKQAIDEAIKAAGNNAKIIVMPYGGSTLPCLEE